MQLEWVYTVADFGFVNFQRVRKFLATIQFSSKLNYPLLYSSVKVSSLSRIQLFVTPWTVAHQPPLSMGFSR